MCTTIHCRNFLIVDIKFNCYLLYKSLLCNILGMRYSTIVGCQTSPTFLQSIYHKIVLSHPLQRGLFWHVNGWSPSAFSCGTGSTQTTPFLPLLHSDLGKRFARCINIVLFLVLGTPVKLWLSWAQRREARYRNKKMPGKPHKLLSLNNMKALQYLTLGTKVAMHTHTVG